MVELGANSISSRIRQRAFHHVFLLIILVVATLTFLDLALGYSNLTGWFQASSSSPRQALSSSARPTRQGVNDTAKPSPEASAPSLQEQEGTIVRRPDIPQGAAEQARNFVQSRREEYHEKGLDYRWKLRGVGYLYTTHNLILLAQLPKDTVVGTTQNVTIHNVSNETFTECNKLTIWVRANGPEIFAGAAQAVQSTDDGSCFWSFSFDLQQPGTYEVDVKLLIWNGDAPIYPSQCEDSTEGLPSNETMNALKHDGFQGFKMYSRTQMCCEICARTPYCVSWATPFLRMPDPSRGSNGCELFFEPSAPDEYLPVSFLWPHSESKTNRRLVGGEPYHGTRHNNPTSYFMGCGWSFWFTLDYQCVSGDLDDRVFSVESTFEALPSSPGDQQQGGAALIADAASSLPLCTLQNEHLGEQSRGRWVREPWADASTCPPFETVKAEGKSLSMTRFIDDIPQCWHREDLSIIGTRCIEMNCRLIDKSSVWSSSVHQEKELAARWQPYPCRYQEFTTHQLQECVTKRKIVRFQKKGTSVAEFLEQFVQHRLNNITMYPDAGDADAITVVYDTLSLLHKANEPEGKLEQEMSNLPAAPPNEEHYWITGFFLSSEREVHTHVSRMEQYNHILAEIMGAKNYKMINAFDMTAAFTFDSATQNDGMHIIGPPMKTLVTKLFHHVCSEAL